MHDGSAPGVTAHVTATPEDGIGVIVLANADQRELSVTEITLLALEKAFGLGTGIPSSSPSANTPTAAATLRRTTSDLRHVGVTCRGKGTAAPYYDVELAGTYSNAGYGTAVLCSMRSSSSSCQRILDNFRSVDKSLSSNSTDLFASWATIFSSYLRFTQTNGRQYIIFSETIYPEGYGKNSTPFSTQITVGLATFVVEDESVAGFGITGISGVNRSGPVEEASDVWFVKQA